MRHVGMSSLGSLVLLGMVGLAAQPATGQEAPPSPLHNVVVAGYGSGTWGASLDDDFTNTFTASLSPVLLYSVGNDFLFEAELEFGLSGEQTTTSLEYAQVDYMGFENLLLVAGKFLLPFGVFGERVHPTWINKLPTSPLLFGHAHGGVAEGALLPVMSDAGFMVRWAKPTSSGWALDVSVYGTNGPKLVTEGDDGHDEGGEEEAHSRLAPVLVRAGDEEHEGEPDLDVPSVGFGVSFSDNNKNKMLGGRVGLVKGPSFEAYLSGFHAMYDEDNFLDYRGAAVSAEWRTGGFEMRGEWILTQQEIAHEESFDFYNRSGVYLQASQRFGAWEPVARWSQLFDPTLEGEAVAEGNASLALGLDYWFSATIPLKFAYEWDREFDDRVIVQWAFGF